ncbi:MAG: ribonuclease P protein component [bacterium]
MQRFCKAARLKSPEEYSAVRRRGISARAGVIAVAVLPAEKQRLGIAVSRRVGGAVERNRIKRVIREFFRLHKEFFPAGDCVVIPAAVAGGCDNKEIRAALKRALGLLAQRLGRNQRQSG